ncbi:MAG: GTP-binding protein HflX [Candidatus Accumulibacter regalis]|jgi:GTP-binding protein HflX|uniref:GTPase HflX n=1 Tax=Accumulibacter regalis TaxID=522306 RepID=A0A011QJM9_ACCRE|nr:MULTISPECIES: GTPase HflX [unclassified Candidatus Accumulibacter]EXI89250.1 MAG: GTP-binding protein HflX [Candidatus Accumulibacter regalis]MQM34706.1 GTPase HflX [Candidatus Accumulibacter phosphatis]MBN8513682.1 GTPase HflX [Accumulibacter sp.]MBO3701176.1 GTPase HflX [Accumulibacter sp.]HRE69262.1 GTPase HflX [Accumulibacter sp.]
MHERPSVEERAVIVQLDFGHDDLAEQLEEVRLLALSAGASICAVVHGRRHSPDAATYAGKGKVGEVAAEVLAHEADLVIFNHELSAGQERNLEQALQCRVIDRTSLILDIFAQRAKSAEGKLQVELAQLEHLSTRLVRGWTHLERQKGGIGLRGPGETQLETDRRLLGIRVKSLKERLVKLERQRGVQRKARGRGELLNVSLVGYTNAGKSTLFNALTHAGVLAADRLFATLDTTTRKLWLAEAGHIVLSDTVGFIRDLPHSLVAAFHATLEATAEADLLLHVVDSASPARDEQVGDVNKVLAEIGAAGVPQLMVLNKLDLTGLPPTVERDEYGTLLRVRVSARRGDGLSLLREALAEVALAKNRNLRQQSSGEADLQDIDMVFDSDGSA